MLYMARPRLLVFAGPNGSGKSSITQEIPILGVYINADKIQSELNCDALTAAQSANDARHYCIENRMDFTIETVLSSPYSFDTLEEAHRAGYEITLIYVLTHDPRINVARVAARMAAGGNKVAEEKIIPRYIRSLALLPKALPLCRRALVYDNSGSRDSLALILFLQDGKLVLTPSPFWPETAILALLQGNYQPPNM